MCLIFHSIFHHTQLIFVTEFLSWNTLSFIQIDHSSVYTSQRRDTNGIRSLERAYLKQPEVMFYRTVKFTIAYSVIFSSRSQILCYDKRIDIFDRIYFNLSFPKRKLLVPATSKLCINVVFTSYNVRRYIIENSAHDFFYFHLKS